MNLQLFHGDTLVGDIDDAFFSDDTGYGVLRLKLSASPVTQRLRDFIRLSEDWHSRLKQGQPHDAGEFDAYRDVYDSDQWQTVSDDGGVARISQPVFISGEVTWRPLKG